MIRMFRTDVYFNHFTGFCVFSSLPMMIEFVSFFSLSRSLLIDNENSINNLPNDDESKRKKFTAAATKIVQ